MINIQFVALIILTFVLYLEKNGRLRSFIFVLIGVSSALECMKYRDWFPYLRGNIDMKWRNLYHFRSVKETLVTISFDHHYWKNHYFIQISKNGLPFFGKWDKSVV